MGCCASTSSKKTKPENKDYRLVNSCNSSEASLQLVEEETVKEVVLSETPLSKHQTLDVLEKISNKNQGSEAEELKTESTAINKHTGKSMSLIKQSEASIYEVFELSDKFSLTESISTAMAPETMGDHGEVTQTSPARVPRKPGNCGEVAGFRESRVRSPARGTVHEQEKWGTSSRVGQGLQVTEQNKIVEPGNGFPLDSGDGSGRRSRSPVTRREMETYQTGRYNDLGLTETGPTSGRSPARKMDNAGKEENSNDNILPSQSETLENPVVSLECFIFL